MPMNKQERHQAMRQFDSTVALTDVIKSKRALHSLGNLSNRVRREVKQFNRAFNQLSPATQLDKRTAFFNAISAETDGTLILHDLGELFDSCVAMINDFRDPDHPVMTQAFTDANVTYYEANGVSD